METEIGIGVIGAGNIFRQRHLPSLAEMDGVSVVALANRSVESAQSVSDEFDLGADAMDEPLELISRDDVDAVMIGTWPYKHYPYGMASLEARKHTFLQARMAMNLREAKTLRAQAAETDVITQICPSPIAMHGDEFVQQLLEEGYVGELYEIHGDFRNGTMADPTEPRHWRQIERYQGFNALALGILIELIHRWVGVATTVSARADTHIVERPRPDGEGFNRVSRPTSVAVNAEMADGATGNFVFSEVDRHAPDSRVELYGSDGTIIYNIDTDTIMAGKAEDDGLSELSVPAELEGEWTVEQDFVEAIRHGGDPQTSFQEGVQYMEFTEAVFRSVESGQQVNLPLAVTSASA